MKRSFLSFDRKHNVNYLSRGNIILNLCQIAFNNGMLDLRTLTIRHGILPSDYLTMTLDYNYEDSFDDAQRQELRTILLKICTWGNIPFRYSI